MKQGLTISVDVPEDYKAYWNGHEVVIVETINELPSTWEEFCKKNPVTEEEMYITGLSDIMHAGIKIRNAGDRNVLPNLRAAQQHRSLMQLHQLRDCYRQGWIPDWGNSNEIKFVITTGIKGGYVIDAQYNYSAFLSFQSHNVAELFLANFKGLIEEAGDLI